jgi:hypothetical protein
MSEQPKPAKQPSLIYINVPPRRSPLRRIGCSILVVMWFIILLLPCFCFALALQGEISVQLGDVPGQSLRIWLLNESDQRGLGISRPVVSAHDGQVCIQTQVSFVMWAGSATGTSFCDCYTRSDGETVWNLMSSSEGTCHR